MRFLPREEKFFELFLDQVRLILEASELLAKSSRTGNSSLVAASEKITALETQADTVLHDIFQRLNQTFITPLDPEDIHSLATHLDDVIDGVEELAHRIVAYRIDPIPPALAEGTAQIGACVKALQLAFEALRSNAKLIDHCIEVNRIEGAVDTLTRNAIRDLFDNERDPIQILKLKEIYDLIEQTTDYCEDVSVALQNVIVKNS